jgi:hypothetical protein
VARQPSPNQQRDLGYVAAINQILKPFTNPPRSTTNYAGARQELQAAISQLDALNPPSQFENSQAELVRALRQQAALALRLEQGHASRDTTQLSNLQRQTGQIIRRARREIAGAYDSCQTGQLKAC